jgi:hypothetical protein
MTCREPGSTLREDRRLLKGVRHAMFMRTLHH